MFMKRLKHVLLRPKTLEIDKADKIIDTGIIAICIIFLQNLIAVDKPDSSQIQSLFAFSIAIPLLASHFLIIQTIDQPKQLVPTFVSKSFEYLFIYGLLCTSYGIIFVLDRVSWVASMVFLASCSTGYIVYLIIRYFKDLPKLNAKKEEETQKPH